MMNKNIFRFIRIIIGFSIFAIVYIKLGLRDTFMSIISIGMLPVLMFFVLFFIFISLGAICLKIIITAVSKPTKFKKIFQYYIMSWAIGQFTPGNLGEFSIVFFLRKEEKMKSGEALAISIADKIITFALIFVIGITAMFFYLPIGKALYLATLVIIISVVLLLLVFNSKLRNKLFKKIFHKRQGIIKEFDDKIKKFFLRRKKYVFINFIITVIRWSVFFVSIKMLFSYLGVSVSLYDVLAISSLSTIVSLIPLSVSGLGIREASAIYLFELIGISTVISGAVFGIFLLVRYISAFLIFILNKIGPEIFINELIELRKKDGK